MVPVHPYLKCFN